MKFGRTYSIQIKPPNSPAVTITPPITAIIETDRHVMATANTCSVTLYNLSQSTRSAIYKDKYVFSEYWQMIIMAGYGSTMYKIFQGNIYEAYSYKEGPEWITKIEAFDGGYAIMNGFVSESVSNKTTKQDLIQRLVAAIPNVSSGAMGSATQGQSARGQVLIGNGYDLLRAQVGDSVFIDGEVVHVLANDEVIVGDIFTIDQGNLYTSPRRRDTFLEVDAIFSPEIKVGYLLDLNSNIPRYNGRYKVYGLKHNVTISGAVGGDAITTVSLYAGTKAFTKVTAP
ncbi:MAG: baseplate hub protein [Rectinemataceae bacterium]